MKMSERDRRDWSLLIFILPLGILLMFIAGQFAIRIIPRWILNVTMGSNLRVDTAGGQQTFMEPLFNIEILTPFAWQDTYLTPNADKGFVFPPFVVLEPSATPSPTEAPPLTETATPPPPVTVLPSATTITPSATVVVTATTPPPLTSTEVPPTSPATCIDPAAINNGGQLPCVYPPPTTCTDPAASNNGGSLPCVYPPTTCTDPVANNNGGPLPCMYPIASTPVPSYTLIDPPPVGMDVDVPPDYSVGEIPDGNYVVASFNIVVSATPDNNYDMVFYEFNNGGAIYLDWIIIGISIYNDGHEYYEVFNWGNGIPDNNSNIGDVAGSETDNQQINLSELYDPDSGTTDNQTGILVDVDNAASHPPAGTYNYLVVVSPNGGLVPAENAQVDAVQTVEVPTP